MYGHKHGALDQKYLTSPNLLQLDEEFGKTGHSRLPLFKIHRFEVGSSKQVTQTSLLFKTSQEGFWHFWQVGPRRYVPLLPLRLNATPSPPVFSLHFPFFSSLPPSLDDAAALNGEPFLRCDTSATLTTTFSSFQVIFPFPSVSFPLPFPYTL
jgi:hypothetical protein